MKYIEIINIIIYSYITYISWKTPYSSYKTPTGKFLNAFMQIFSPCFVVTEILLILNII
jgi:hypothetical protein